MRAHKGWRLVALIVPTFVVLGVIGWRALPDKTPPVAGKAATLSQLELIQIAQSIGQSDELYHITKQGDVFKTDAAGHSVSFTDSGLQFGDSFSMGMPGADYSNPVVSDNRIEFDRGAYTEWYINGPMGLEQGFTLREPKAIELELTDATVALSDDAQSAVITASNRTFTYSGLSAFDATGRKLAARLRLDGSRLAIITNTSGAVFPVTIDPLVQEQEISDSYYSTAQFGASVDLDADGTRLIIGAPRFMYDTGTAWIYKRVDSTWVLESQIVASDISYPTLGGFGYSVSMDSDGSHVAVGANIEGSQRGAVYVFYRDDNPDVPWHQQAKLVADTRVYSSQFGYSNDISSDGSRVIVGAIYESSSTGGAYVFASSSGSPWHQEAQLVPSDAAQGNYIGADVSISGDGSHAAISAYGNGVGDYLRYGAAYVFARTGADWLQEYKASANDGATDEDFGYSIAISNDGSRIAVGARDHAVGATLGQGAIYVFASSSESPWGQEAQLVSTDTPPGVRLGRAVAMNGDGSLVIASRYASAYPWEAVVNSFTRSGSVWSESERKAGNDSDYYGNSVAVSSDGTRSVVGNSRGGNSGASVFVYQYLIPETLSITFDPSSTGTGTASSSPSGFDCTSNCSAVFGRGQVVTLNAIPDVGSVFDGWSGDADCNDGEVTMSAAVSCTATFTALDTYNLSVTVSGNGAGTVNSSPAGINACPDACISSFYDTTQVVLTATAGSNSYFVSWAGGGVCDGSTDNQITVTISGNAECNPTFSRKPYEVSVSTDGQTYTLPDSPITMTISFNEDVHGHSDTNPYIVIYGGSYIDEGPTTNCGDADEKTWCFAYTLHDGIQNEMQYVGISNAYSASDVLMYQDAQHTFIVNTFVDTQGPTVSYLGDGTTDYELPFIGNLSRPNLHGATLVFNEELDAAGKTAVETALANGTVKSLTFRWLGAQLRVSYDGSGIADTAQFLDDVYANVTDSLGNVTNNLLLIDSAPTLQSEVWVDDDWSTQDAVDVYNDSLELNVNAFSSVQDAIDATETGGTVTVRPGNYYENIEIWRAVTLTGSGVDEPATVFGDGSSPVYIYASDVTVSGFVLDEECGMDSCDVVVFVHGYDNTDNWNDADISGINIHDNEIKNGYRGVGLNYTVSNSIVEDNNIHDAMVGVLLGGGVGNIVRGNIIHDTGDNSEDSPIAAIAVRARGNDNAEDNQILNNQIYDNYNVGIYVEASNQASGHGVLIQGNTIYDNGLEEYYGGSAAISIKGDNTEVRDNVIAHNAYYGVRVGAGNNGGDGTIIDGNTIGSATITDVPYAGNTVAGIRIEGGSDISITDNQILENGTLQEDGAGIYIVYDSGTNNEAHYNNISRNLSGPVEGPHYGLFNESPNSFDASNNFWGSETGPGGVNLENESGVNNTIGVADFCGDNEDEPCGVVLSTPWFEQDTRVPAPTPDPTVYLKGDQFMSIAQGDVWEDPGYDSEVTPVVSGSVDTTTPGEYTILYTSGLVSLSRIVRVQPDEGREFRSTPLAGGIGTNTNGDVCAFAVGDDNELYIGGQFSNIGFRAGNNQMLLDPVTGKHLVEFPEADYVIKASVPDGSGGWYVGGLFTEIGGLPIGKLAHINSDYTVDESFDLDVDDSVNALVLDGTTLYIGGAFSSVASEARYGVAAVNVATGTLLPFNPIIEDRQFSFGEWIYVSGAVTALALDDSTLYIGGLFDRVNGDTDRRNIAAVDAASGEATEFAPQVDSWVYALLINGTTVYAGGEINSAGFPTANVSRSGVVAFDATTSELLPFAANATNIYHIAMYGGQLFIGGDFTWVNINLPSQDFRPGLVSVDPVTGVLTTFDLGVSVGVRTFVFHGSTGYAFGPSTAISFNADTAEIIDSFAPSMNASEYDCSLYDDASDSVYICGGFEIYEPLDRSGFAKINRTSGLVDSLQIDSGTGSMRIGVMVRSGNTLYIGGNFDTVLGQTRNNIAAIDLTTGALLPFDPNIGTNADSRIYTIVVHGSAVYVGGDFELVNGNVARNSLAAFDAVTGDVLPFDPNLYRTGSGGSPGWVQALVVDGATIYAAGQFDQVNGSITKINIAAFDSAGDVIPAFDVGDMSASADVFALALREGTLYIGGYFSTINDDVSRTNFAAVNATTGVVTDLNIAANERVNTIALDGKQLYLGGAFTTLGGQSRSYLGGINLRDSEVLPFDGQLDRQVCKVSADRGSLEVSAGNPIMGF